MTFHALVLKYTTFATIVIAADSGGQRIVLQKGDTGGHFPGHRDTHSFQHQLAPTIQKRLGATYRDPALPCRALKTR